MKDYSIVKVGYFKYSLFKSSTKKCVYVDGFADRRKKLPKTVTIPSKIEYKGETYFVFGIMCSAFSNSFAHQPDELIIEEGIEFISQHAFYCAGYKKIVVPKSVCSLGYSCFLGNPDISFEGSDFSGITSINGSLSTIFGSLKPLYSILEQDPEGLGFYLGKVFVGISPCDYRYVDKKLDLHIKEGIEALYLEELVLPSGYNITLPSTIKRITLSKTMCRCDWRVPSLELWCRISFSGYFNPGVMPFENIYIGDSKEPVKDLIISGTICISDHAFHNYLHIKNIIIKKGVIHIGTGAFQCDYSHIDNSLSIDKIRLPHGLESIRSSAFSGRKFTGIVDLPPTTLFLGNNCFDGLNGDLIIHSIKLVRKFSHEIKNSLKTLFSITIDPFDISEITMRELYNSLRGFLLDSHHHIVARKIILSDKCLGPLKECEEKKDIVCIDVNGKTVEALSSSKYVVDQYLSFPIFRNLNIFINPERKEDFLNHKVYSLLKSNYSLFDDEIYHSGSNCLCFNLDEDRDIYVIQPKLTTTDLENSYFGWITVPKTYQSKKVEIDPFAFFDCPDIYGLIVPKGYSKNLVINTDIDVKEID